jgi:hypothetical protein
MPVQPSLPSRMDDVPDDFGNVIVDWLVLASLRDVTNWVMQVLRSEVPIFGCGWGTLKGTFIDEAIEEQRADKSTGEMVTCREEAGYQSLEDWSTGR